MMSKRFFQLLQVTFGLCTAVKCFIGAILTLWALQLGAGQPFMISELEFKESRVIDVIRVLAEDSNVNIIATPKAGEKKVTLFLKDVTLEQAVRAICRISGLWYRVDGEEHHGTFRLMTKKEYSKDLVIGQDDKIKVFQLRNPNVLAIASAIEDLYDERVEVSYGNGIQSLAGGAGNFGNNSRFGNNNNNRFGGRNSNRNRFNNNNGRNGRGFNSGSGNNNRINRRLPEDLSVRQLEQLASDNAQIDPGKLAKVSGIDKLIYVTVNIEHNLLVVKTSDTIALKSIASLVQQLDKPQTQVMLEMKIIEIEVGEDFDSLFNLELIGTKASGDSTNPIVIGGAAMSGGGTLVYEFLSEHVKVNIELLEQNNRLNILSNPMVVASNHRPAKLFIGEERVMVRGYSVDIVDTQTTSRTITTPETQLEQIGTTLEITPHINTDGSIHLILKQENSTVNVGGSVIPIINSEGQQVDLPVDTVNTATLEGEIFARHGYTVAVGGLIRDSFSRNRRKVPFFADIPGVGNVFRSTQDAEEKSELVLMVTPYILNQGEHYERYDPTSDYYRYAPQQPLQAIEMPKKPEQPVPECGKYCAPNNLKRSDP